MKVLVPIKRVPDFEAKIKVKADGTGIETDGIKWIVNPFDEIAIEEAIRWKEAGSASEVIVVSIGPSDIATQMRYALAMGADKGVHIKYDGVIDSDLAARAIAEVYKKDSYGAVILGKQAIDSDAGQTPQLLAARLNLPQASFASKIVLEEDSVLVTREVDGGLETVRIPRPCVISTDLRLNTPRYASLPGIMKAKKKPLDEVTLEALGVAAVEKVKILKMYSPQKRGAGKKVENVEALVKALQEEVKVF